MKKEKIPNFRIKVWRKYYDEINKLARYLRQCRIDFVVLELHKIHDIQSRINGLMRECMKYMNENGAPLPPSKWTYNADDESTHLSHEKFSYHHLLGK